MLDGPGSCDQSEQFQPARGSELRKQTGHMKLDSARADPNRGGDLFVAFAKRDEAQNFIFTSREGGRRGLGMSWGNSWMADLH